MQKLSCPILHVTAVFIWNVDTSHLEQFFLNIVIQHRVSAPLQNHPRVL